MTTSLAYPKFHYIFHKSPHFLLFPSQVNAFQEPPAKYEACPESKNTSRVDW